MHLFLLSLGTLWCVVTYISIPSVNTDNRFSVNSAMTQFVSKLSGSGSAGELISSVKSIASSFSEGFTAIVGGTFGGLVNLILVLVMSFYLSIQERGIVTFLRIVTPVKHEKYVIDLWARTQRKIGLWFQGQLLLALL